MIKGKKEFTSEPFPRSRLLMTDGGNLGLKKHMVHGLIEMDISEARKAIRKYRRDKGEKLSFSAFFLSCLGKAIEKDRQIHGYRSWRNKLIVFDNIDVNMLFEVDVDGVKTVRPHIIREVNLKSPVELHKEMQDFQQMHHSSREAKFINRFVWLPKLLRRIILKWLLMNPLWLKEYFGTVMVSSLGIFSSGGSWGIPVPNHTLQLTLGSVYDKPCLSEGRLENRQFMSMTVSVDHDIIDGLPVTRFINRLRTQIEKGPFLFTEMRKYPS